MDIKSLQGMCKELGINPQVMEFDREVETGLKERFEGINTIAEYNQMKTIKGMQDSRASDIRFAVTTGYGYNDLDRDTLENVHVSVLHGESALVHPQLISGTHALHVALSGSLRPGDELLSPVSKPYDTLGEVIGIRDSVGSLKGYGMTYRQVDLLEDGSFDSAGIAKAMNPRAKLVTTQHSKGYATCPTLSVDRVGELISFVKEIRPDVTCMVDNCYGEFVEEKGPTGVGADMIVGSLVKNPGGGLAPISGCTVGTKECVNRASYHLSAPELGKKVGTSLGINQQLYRGLSFSPTVVAGALRGAVFVANIYERLGFQVAPGSNESRRDIIQAITLGTSEGVIALCKGIRATAPVGNYVTPESQNMPGYDSRVIMAAGASVQGSSIEFSADGPIRPPYAVYFQGRLAWYHAKLGILKSLQQLLGDDVLRILR